LKLTIHAHFGGLLGDMTGSPWNWVPAQGIKKTRVLGLSDGRKRFKISLAVFTQYRLVMVWQTDRQTDSQHACVSITPVLSRSFEKYMVRSHIYPALQEPTSWFYFADQFFFRPTGSTTAALIALFHTILTMLSTNPFVRVIALDFSKAFDTVRHATLIDKKWRNCRCQMRCWTGSKPSLMDIHTAQNIQEKYHRMLIFKPVWFKDPGLDQRHLWHDIDTLFSFSTRTLC